jgi:hypothetical protein
LRFDTFFAFDQKRRYITLETIQETQQEFWTRHEKQAVGIGAATKMSLDAMVRIVTENKWKTASGREISIGAINRAGRTSTNLLSGRN